MLQLHDNPPMLPDGVNSLNEMKGTWWVAHTKSRFEKAFAWDLVHRSMGFFLPMVQKSQISGGRKRTVLMPLFPSYVFCCGSEEDRYTALTTNRLCQTISVADQAVLVKQLEALRIALGEKAELNLYPFAVAGHRCRIKAGPLLGIEGTVVQRSRISRVVLEVSILGQGAAVEIDADFLESVD